MLRWILIQCANVAIRHDEYLLLSENKEEERTQHSYCSYSKENASMHLLHVKKEVYNQGKVYQS